MFHCSTITLPVKANSMGMQTWFQSVNITFVRIEFSKSFEWKGEVVWYQEVLGNTSCFQSHFRGVTHLC